ncbi:DUF5366 family protein [Exiguobacterium flavidum]|uniref:DUF5366 family protein n=1 Tax=Exiguobacterium flavidum TaxID=2184695 RepID=UPI000DF7AF8D|nr:DUF5366 family protein [Exiguobacterium flavidum]
MRTNVYLLSYAPLISILLFSTSLAIATSEIALRWLRQVGVYSELLQILSARDTKLLVWLGFLVIYFMVFSTLKLVSDTINQLGFAFFLKEQIGTTLGMLRPGAILLLVGGCASFAFMTSFPLVCGVLGISFLIYFIFYTIQISKMTSTAGAVGLILFLCLMWGILIAGLVWLILTLLNSFGQAILFET